MNNIKLVISSLLIASTTWGYTTDTLPFGVRSPSFRFGVISGLDQTYSQDGTLLNLGESRSITFNANTLAKVSSEARVLINALNQFGSKKLGQDINLGTLKIDSKPEVNYWAPVFAYGVKKNWTLALGVPIINYKNSISLSSQPANLDFYRSQFSGLSAELDQALNINLSQKAVETLQSKGYKPLENRSESFLGDIQLASIYQIYKSNDQALALQTQLNLPTGPHYDADDLMALNTFGKTSIDNTLVYSYHFGSFEVLPAFGVTLALPDQVTMRVPLDENDNLPDANQKENIKRSPGHSANTGVQLNYSVNPAWTLKTGVEATSKLEDNFEGHQKLRYDLLSKNTASNAVRSKLGVGYSTVNQYFAKQSVLPAIASLEISDTFYGQNIERRLQTEINLMVFF